LILLCGYELIKGQFMNQKISSNLQDMQINSTQLIANQQIFSLNEITAVRHGYIEPKPIFPLIFIIMGFCLLLFNHYLMIAGGLSILLGLGVFFSSETLYTVVVETVHGEHIAFASESRDAVDSAIRAINTAIINRG
jgi:hypothetical protein